MGERMRLRARTKLGVGAVLAVVVCALAASTGTATGASGISAVPLAGTGSPQTGDFTPASGEVTEDEFAGEGEETDTGPDQNAGTIILSDC